MKKIGIMIIILFLCVACHSSSSQEQFKEYYQIKEQLMSCENFDESYPFQVRLVFNQIDDKYRYDVIIDQPEIDMYYIEAMAYAHGNDDEMCPVLVIVDDSVSHLKVGYVDKTEHFYKGVQLSGQCLEKQDVRLYISYYLDEAQKQKVEKYIEVKI